LGRTNGTSRQAAAVVYKAAADGTAVILSIHLPNCLASGDCDVPEEKKKVIHTHMTLQLSRAPVVSLSVCHGPWSL